MGRRFVCRPVRIRKNFKTNKKNNPSGWEFIKKNSESLTSLTNKIFNNLEINIYSILLSHSFWRTSLLIRTTKINPTNELDKNVCFLVIIFSFAHINNRIKYLFHYWSQKLLSFSRHIFWTDYYLNEQVNNVRNKCYLLCEYLNLRIVLSIYYSFSSLNHMIYLFRYFLLPDQQTFTVPRHILLSLNNQN